ncbi:MAG: response regulator [Deltaproteobacteria bacterium]|nr:response regulator [Deltaproteobacteria bacterium]
MAIDDDLDVLDIISTALGREGYDVHSCDSPRKSLFLLSRHDFDLVLLNILMPELDGIQVASHIINNSINVEIIMMTAQPDRTGIDVRCPLFHQDASGSVGKCPEQQER